MRCAISSFGRLRPSWRIFFVERGFGDHLTEQLPVQTERARLIGRDRLADLPDQLLQSVVVCCRNRSTPISVEPTLATRRGAEAAEDVADAPDRERDRDQAQQDAGDQAAEPVAGSVLNSAQHESSGSFVIGDEVKRTGIIEIAVYRCNTLTSHGKALAQADNRLIAGAIWGRNRAKERGPMAHEPRPLVAGNWKMNGLARIDRRTGSDYRRRREPSTGGRPDDLPAGDPDRELCRRRAAGSAIAIGAQDCHAEVSGAFTGDLSAEMLKDAGATAVIVGHSERRNAAWRERRDGEGQGRWPPTAPV